MPFPIVADELALLDRVSRLLAEVPYDLPPSEHEVVRELVRLRDEVRGAKEEDKPALMQQYDHHYALMAQLRATRERPQVDPSCPYFAHLRLEEDGRKRDLFLGKATRIDGGLRIVDWRNAPISRVFYSYQQGDEYEEEFGERVVEGRILARRTVAIRNGELRRVDCPEGSYLRGDADAWTLRERQAHRLAGGQGASRTKVHDGGAPRRLGTDTSGAAHRADKHLPDIAGLIDAEQFALITRPSAGFVVIRGTAGSGKTTVALHRIAWLAYDEPAIDSHRTLFLVFSRALRDYVSQVLPALGLHRVAVRTFPEWATATRRKQFPFLPKKYREDTPEVVVRLKSHPATMVALEQHVAAHAGPATVEQAYDDWASVLTQPEVLLPVLELLAADDFTAAERQRAMTWLRDRHDELEKWRSREPDGVGVLDREDDPLLLRAWQLRVGPLKDPQGEGFLRYRHVAIDEVQDFSPVEVRVLLGCLDARQSITLAGDTQQHVMQSQGFSSWTRFFEWLGVPGTAVDTLRVAYRSARPIVELAQAVLGPLAEDDTPPMTVRDGPPVELFRHTDHGAVVAALAEALTQLHADEPLANCAIVVPSAELATTYENGLRAANVPRVRRVIDEQFSFQPGVEIVENTEVKGLEFDYVVIVEANAWHYPDNPVARRLLHVAVTRAIHQLWITCTGTLSPVLRQAIDAGHAQDHDA